ncbi:MAG: CesT family type III secretion system chaperone [Endozoicomonadaceae bacterium]|nr:CesT family type III secretion system chaperone [Endozoicomonadaceae bacterium]
MQQHQQKVSQWLNAIGKMKNLPLALGDDGHCTLTYGSDLACIIEVPQESKAGAVFIYSPLYKLPRIKSDQTSLLKSALTLNMFGLQTSNCQISLDPRTDLLVLTLAVPIDILDEWMFSQILGDFLDAGNELHTKLNNLTGQR